MKDPTLPLQSAIVAAVIAELTTQGYASAASRVAIDPRPNDPLPRVIVGQSTSISFRDKSSDGADATHTMVAWATTPVEAAQVADYALQAVTDRSSPLSVTGYNVHHADLDFRGESLREDAPGTDSGYYWGVPVRVRYWMTEA